MLALAGVFGCGVVLVFDAYMEGQNDLNNRSSLCSSTPTFSPCNKLISTKQLRHLEQNGYVIIDNALNKNELHAAINDVTTMHEDVGRTGLLHLLHSVQKRDHSKHHQKDILSSKLESEIQSQQYRTDSFQFLMPSDRQTIRETRESSINETKLIHPDDSCKWSGEGEGLLYAQNLVLGIGKQLQIQNFRGFYPSGLEMRIADSEKAEMAKIKQSNETLSNMRQYKKESNNNLKLLS